MVDDVEKQALLKACDAMSKAEWNEITGAIAQRDSEFICRRSEQKEADVYLAKVDAVVETLRAWAALQERL